MKRELKSERNEKLSTFLIQCKKSLPFRIIAFPVVKSISLQARSAVVAYLGVAVGGDGAKKTSLSFPPHPSLRRAYDVKPCPAVLKLTLSLSLRVTSSSPSLLPFPT